jgi:hypothetical protein
MGPLTGAVADLEDASVGHGIGSQYGHLANINRDYQLFAIWTGLAVA